MFKRQNKNNLYFNTTTLEQRPAILALSVYLYQSRGPLYLLSLSIYTRVEAYYAYSLRLSILEQRPAILTLSIYLYQSRGPLYLLFLSIYTRYPSNLNLNRKQNKGFYNALQLPIKDNLQLGPPRIPASLPIQDLN